MKMSVVFCIFPLFGPSGVGQVVQTKREGEGEEARMEQTMKRKRQKKKEEEEEEEEELHLDALSMTVHQSPWLGNTRLKPD